MPTAHKEKQGRAFYAAPGADDRFLRPGAGDGYAPRQIAVHTGARDTWLAWVHRRAGDEFLAVTRRHAGVRGRLAAVDRGAALAKPAFLDTGAAIPHLYCAVSAASNTRIHGYECRSRAWTELTALPTACTAVYHMDAVSAADGTAYLAYAGPCPSAAGPQVFLRMCRRGRWGREQHQEPPPSGTACDRPRLVAAGSGRTLLVADMYTADGYRIAWKTVSASGAAAWQYLTVPDNGSDLFPAPVVSAAGQVWLAWLHQTCVRRDDVLGFRQEARVARLEGESWQSIGDGAAVSVADLNLGLLPVRRYFGYDGLRRYPRLLATVDGAVWLLWEQQKSEDEVWDNIANGFLCARRWHGGSWQAPVQLLDRGACFAFDPKRLQHPHCVRIAAKTAHRPAGNDFELIRIDARRAAPWSRPSPRLWRGWKPYTPRLPKRGRPAGVADHDPGRLFWGDLHCHSVFSPDAEGEPDELLYTARDLAGLDFVCIADNDFYPQKVLLDTESHYTAQLAASLSRDHEFIAFSGYEWTYHRPDTGRSFNHRIVVFPSGEQQIARRHEPAGRSHKAFRAYLERVRYFNFPHHAYWRRLHSPGEWAVEVTAAWGLYILDASTVFDALNAGDHFAFLGNGDSHRFLPGLSGALTGVYASALTRTAILAAIRAGRCFATTGNRTAVEFRCNAAFMGATVAVGAPPCLSWRVQPQTALESVSVIRDGAIVHRADVATGTWTDRTLAPGRHWYVLQVKEAGAQTRYPHNVAPARGKYAWSSPIRVTAE